MTLDIDFYNTDYLCQYKSDIFIETDNINDNEKEFIRNALYRNDILYIFDSDDFDEVHINRALNKLYTKLKEFKLLEKFFENILEKIKETYFLSNCEHAFIILFSYDFLYLMHPCLCEYIKIGNISNKNILALENAIK